MVVYDWIYNMKMLLLISLMFVTYDVSSNEKDKYVLQNLNQDFIHCYAYWKINALGAERAGDQRRTKLFSDTADRYLNESLGISKLIDMSMEAVIAASELSIESIGNEMDHDFVNVSIIVNKYSKFCKNLLERTDQRVEYWEKKYR